MFLPLLLVLGGACRASSGTAAVPLPSTATSTSDAAAPPVDGQTTPGNVSHYAGAWSRDGLSVTVKPSGNIEVTYRTNRSCPSDPQPCDETVGETIVGGGRLVGRLVPFTERSARVVVASDNAQLVGTTPVIFELLDDGKVRLAQHILCSGSTTDPLECGA